MSDSSALSPERIAEIHHLIERMRPIRHGMCRALGPCAECGKQMPCFDAALCDRCVRGMAMDAVLALDEFSTDRERLERRVAELTELTRIEASGGFRPARVACPNCGGNGSEFKPFDGFCPSGWAHHLIRKPTRATPEPSNG